MPELEKVKCSTPDFAVENAKKLLALFPECEGQTGEVDIDKLRQVLSSTAIEGNVERYQFTWPGKRNAMAAASAATTKTLRPCAAESVGRDGTPGGFDSENLYIEGDNLEVLKLLQTSYAGKVKMIYIDPPYNTGHDFVYRDRFSLTDAEKKARSGEVDDDGLWNISHPDVNEESSARYHSNWCSMMYPRLKLARNLLRDDGVIFVSIDDNEVTNMRKLCDEVFGESNFIGTVIWERAFAPKNDAKYYSDSHDYVLTYAKKLDSFDIGLLPRTEEANARYKNPDNDPKGPWTPDNMTVKTYSANYDYEITTPSGKVLRPTNGRCWFTSRERMEKLIAEGRVWFGEDGGNMPRLKRYLSDVQQGMTPTTIWKYTDVGSNQESRQELKHLFDDKGLFDGPKPIRLIQKMLKIGNCREHLILDFFSGSGTTAHAILQLNAEDGGSRKFIMVQLPEACVEDSEAAKSGYKNICEIGKERIRRAGKRIAEELAAKNAEIAKKNEQGELGLENPDNPAEQESLRDSASPRENNLDIGFRVLKLDSSSLRDTSATVSETNQEFANFERVRSDRSAEDLLFQMLLETHIPLSEPIVKAKVAGNEVLFVGCDGEGAAATSGAPLAACLDAKAKMTTEFFIEIAKLKPCIAFFRDDAFADDSARTNLQQVFNQFSPTTSITVI